MQIFANKNVLPFNITTEKTLGELVNSLLLLTSQANKVLTDLVVDGTPVSLDDRESFQERPLNGIETVDLTVGNKLEIVLYVLLEAKKLLPQFQASLSEVADLLMAGQKHKAMSLFGTALGIWRKVVNYLKTVGMSYELNFGAIQFEDKSLEEKNMELLGVLQEIKKAMENEDSVMLGDLIEYELLEKVAVQGRIIDELIKIIQETDKRVNEEIRAKLNEHAVGV